VSTPASRIPATSALAKARRWEDTEGSHVDVRGLPPPEPLVAILELVASIRNATAVIVHHDRDPKLLYPELAELGWTAERIEGNPGEVRLKLERAA
jgi:uncharacterized protein (DUF2249 family)